MSVFANDSFDSHEHVAFHADPESGLKAIVAIHSTALGPALGGCRMWDYATEAEAVTDVLRLSRGMTFKNALAELPWGGGKSVILGDAARDKTPAMMQALGRFVDRLGGRYTVAEDVGTTPRDMFEAAKFTNHVRGVEGVGFDPSPGTAWGVFKGLEASVAHRLNCGLRGLRVSVQGLGHVGFALAGHLHAAGAQLIVTDVDEAAVRRAADEFAAKPVEPDAIYDAEADVFAPCALGATLNDATVGRLAVAVVAGAANNQLAEPRHAQALAERGILYAPDYVINAGGVIHIYHEGPAYDRDAAFAHIGRIAGTLQQIFARAERDAILPAEAADRLALERIAAADRTAEAAE
jgi:leucine dehydrogenase